MILSTRRWLLRCGLWAFQPWRWWCSVKLPWGYCRCATWHGQCCSDNLVVGRKVLLAWAYVC